MTRRQIVAVTFALGCVLVFLFAPVACTPTDRATLARTALDSADRGCRAYLELRREPDAGSDGAP